RVVAYCLGGSDSACCLSLIFACCLLFSSAAPATQLYSLSLHDALPISCAAGRRRTAGSFRQCQRQPSARAVRGRAGRDPGQEGRSEEHTSELQSRENLVCRLLLEKKKNIRQKCTVSTMRITPAMIQMHI